MSSSVSPSAEQNPRTSWIQDLKREELIAIIHINKLPYDPRWNIDTLRKVLRAFILEGRTHVVQQLRDIPVGSWESLKAEIVASNQPPAANNQPPEQSDTAYSPSPSPGTSPSASRSQATRTTIDLKMIQRWNLSFSGTEDPVEFLERIDDLRKLHEVRGSELLKALPHLLKDSAAVWSRMSRDGWVTWNDFVEAFKVRYFPRGYQDKLEEEARSRLQKPDESIVDYEVAIKTLFRRYEGFTESEKRRIFYRNLKPEIKLFMRQDYNTMTIDQMVEQGRIYEDIMRQQEEFKAKTRSTPKERTEATSQRKLWNFPNTTNTPTCWQCNQSGHYRADCPTLKNKGQEKKPGEVQIKKREDGELSIIEYSGSLQDGRPHIDLKIQGIPALALLDTGATKSYVNEIIARKCANRNATVVAKKDHVILANGNTSNTMGRVRAKVEIGDAVIYYDFIIMPKLTSEVVLGIDILKELEVKLDLGQMRKNSDTIFLASSVVIEELPTIGLQELTNEEKERLEGLLSEKIPLCSEEPSRNHGVKHRIRLLPGTQPIKQRYYPLNPAMQEVAHRELDNMLKKGVVRPSSSPWSSPIVLVKKPNGKYRFAVDYRKVNEVSEKDAYPMPQVEATLGKLRRARYLTTIDLKEGYWNIPMHEDSIPITAFTVLGKGLFEFSVMPYGLHSAPATFQRLQDTEIITPDIEEDAFAYLDDIVIVTETFDRHMKVLSIVLDRLREK